MEITKSNFGTLHGTPVVLYTLQNKQGAKVKISTYGGTVTELWMPDRNGNLGNVVLGFDTLDEYRSENYLKTGPYFGAIVGRYGNRIANGKFTLDGKAYQLAVNNGKNHLHGGNVGYDKVLWTAKEILEQDAVGLQLSYLSPDGEENYPGNLNITVTYQLTNSNEFKIQYGATTDKATPCNLTNHSYFNLSAGKNNSAMEHELTLLADTFVEVNADLIPTGNKPAVAGTPMDFRTKQVIGTRINDDFGQLEIGAGYDHTWIANQQDGKSHCIAKLYEPQSGRAMEVYTTEPGVQFYAANFLNKTLVRKDGRVFDRRSGVCLETQHFPDSPNQPKFPSAIVTPQKAYSSETIYRFLAE